MLPIYFARGKLQRVRASAVFVSFLSEAERSGARRPSDARSCQVRFGPDVEWVDTINYDVDPRRAESFYAAIREYCPGLPDGALQPTYAGIRPKLSGPGEPAADFLIQGTAAHGVRGLVNLFGIESPGLTAGLTIAQRDCETFPDRPERTRGAD